MTATFEQFLAESKSRVVEHGRTTVRIFDPGLSHLTPQINAAGAPLGVPLPVSYETFLKVCGPGRWCGVFVAAPEDLYAFDENCGEMEGLVALVHNVRGVGDFVAMNPLEQTAPGEWAMDYCSHDPPGCARMADSFESWVRDAVTAFEAGVDLYAKPAADVREEWARGMRTKFRTWWQFWR
jgi:hypothetical protein